MSTKVQVTRIENKVVLMDENGTILERIEPESALMMAGLLTAEADTILQATAKSDE